MLKQIMLFILIPGFVCAQVPEKKHLTDFDYIVNRIRSDYPGYDDKVNLENIEELKNIEKEIRRKIALNPDSCYKYFNDYTSWFRDHHLRVSTNHNSSTNHKVESYDKKYMAVEIDSLRTIKISLEGVWMGIRGEIAIKKQDNKYIGVAIGLSGYDQNQIVFEANDIGNNEFELTRCHNNHSQLERASLLLDQTVLEIHENTRYVRSTLNRKADMAFLFSYMPRHPNGLNTYSVALSLNESTFYLRTPSFRSSQANELVEKYWDEIITRPNLIIDIRNNGGGQDYYYEKLSELIYTNRYESKGVEWYSTKGIIKDWEEAIKNGHIKEGGEERSKALVEKMKTNIGGYILAPDNNGDTIIERDTVYKYPKRVGIIINGGNASSAEQFLLTAQKSSKVTLFGNENTAGVLDYSNITPKELPSGDYNLWLPATRSRRLPANPIDNTGIAPDVYIPLEPTLQLFDRLDNWVYFVKCYLEIGEQM